MPVYQAQEGGRG